MNYEKMWEELKKIVEDQRAYHESGIMQTLAESIQGEAKCSEFLGYMKKLEEKYSNS